MTTHQHRRTKGEIRQRLRRYVNLGFLSAWAETPDGWQVTTPAGESETLPTDSQVWAWCSGYGMGYWAGQRETAEDQALQEALDTLVERHGEEFAALLDAADAAADTAP